MLQEMVARTGTTLWAEVALVIFFLSFVAIVVWTWRRPDPEMHAHAQMALSDGECAARGSAAAARGKQETKGVGDG